MSHGAMLQQIGAVILPNIGGILGGFFYRPDSSKWSDSLKKPSWQPPKYVFAPVWTTLYSCMGYASYIVWKEGGGFEGARLPLTLYGAQLAINWAWTPMFFGLKSTKLGLVNFAFLIPTALATTCEFFKVNQVAGALMVPYMGWLSIAVFLNYTIHKLNSKTD